MPNQTQRTTCSHQTELDEDDEYTHEWHLTYYGGGIWEIEYSKAPELCTVVYRGKLPTREVFLTVMANVEDAPSWANAEATGPRNQSHEK